MEFNWESSDGSYDARISLSIVPNNNLGCVENKAIVNLDLDYLEVLRHLENQPAEHNPTNEPLTLEQQSAILFGDEDSSEGDLRGGETFGGTSEGQQFETRTTNDLRKDDDDEAVQETAAEARKRTEGNEMLLDFNEGDNAGEVDKMIGVAVVEGDAQRSQKKSCQASDGEKAVELENASRGQPNEEENIAQLENGMEQLVRSLSEFEKEDKENQLDCAHERNARDLNEVKRIKKKAADLENSIKERAMQLTLIMNRFEEEVGKNIDENLTLSNGVGARSLVQPGMIINNIKVEPGPYVPDDDVEILDDAAVKQCPFVPAMAGHIHLSENGVAEAAAEIEFRRDLMEVLSKPFDEDEYANLTKLFNEGPYRRSYPSAGRTLNKIRYRRKKRLNFLRGFFYWHENMRHVGAFRPWKDQECLATRPAKSQRTAAIIQR